MLIKMVSCLSVRPPGGARRAATDRRRGVNSNNAIIITDQNVTVLSTELHRCHTPSVVNRVRPSEHVVNNRRPLGLQHLCDAKSNKRLFAVEIFLFETLCNCNELCQRHYIDSVNAYHARVSHINEPI